MTNIKKIQKKLKKTFGVGVIAKQENDCVVLSGNVVSWDDVVQAGRLAACKNKKYTVVNDVKCKELPENIYFPQLKDTALQDKKCDVLVIGAGIVGCAIARELMRYNVSVVIVDKEHDVAMHASSRNDGMVHPGADLNTRQVKMHYNLRGNKMYDDLCKELDVPFERCGQYLCFNKAYLKPFLNIAPVYWHRMGVPVNYVSEKELKLQEPFVNEDIKCALRFPTAGIVCPYGLTIAMCENAVDNGASLFLDTAVLNINVKNNIICGVETNRGTLYPSVVVNAAGVFSEDIAKMAGDRFFSIHPRKGINSIADKKSAFMLKTIVSGISTNATKTTHSKGGGMVSTIDGNVLIGPDAKETMFKEDFATEDISVKNTYAKQKITIPSLNERDIITYFAGIRAATYEEDFVITKGKNTKNIVHAAGIQSPGLTAAPAIAQDVALWAAQLATNAENPPKNEKFNPLRKAIINVAKLQDKQRDELIKQNPDYGVILCRCEQISKGEILDALRRSIPCDTVDGVKKRVRAGMGRCQGGFCQGPIMRIIAKEKHLPQTAVTKCGGASYLSLGKIKEISDENL